MANKTTNYGLTKPLPEEFYDIQVQNNNMDIIDTNLKKVSDDSKKYTDEKFNDIPTPDVSGQISTHNDDLSAHPNIRSSVNAVQTNLTNHTNNKNNPHGVTAAQIGAASLDSTGKVPAAQLPEISSVKTYTATIGTSWTENEDTGVKSQNVAISGVTANHTAKVDHRYNGNGTSDGYAIFVEEENQYLNFITNGYAETYNGGITFYIFGDANTVNIPIVVEVA